MILGTFEKQPAETLDYDIDFTPILDDGDLLATSGDPPVPIPLDRTVTPSGLSFGPTFVLNGTTYKQWVFGGTSGVRYKITVTATTNAGRVKQVEFVIRVKDE